MQTAQPRLAGYWWQCTGHVDHAIEFSALVPGGLTRFFFALASSAWDQSKLVQVCPTCKAEMRIGYEFPRQRAPERLLLLHAVGLAQYGPDYLPMLWESQAAGETESWFDIKYVSYSNGRYSSFGLMRPAVLSRDDIRRLFDTYRQVTGRPLVV